MIKISELTPKSAPLADTDLVEIAEETMGGFESKSITGHEILATARTGMQLTLVSGTNIKTVNSTSLLGSGDLAVQPTLVSGTNIKTLNSTSLLGSGNIALTKSDFGLGNVDNTSDANKPVSTATQTALNLKQSTLVSGTNIKTINGGSLLGSGDLTINTGVSLIAKKTMVTQTGSSAIVLIASEDISSYIVSNSMIQVTAMYRKTVGILNYTPRLYVNTSATLVGATLIATFGSIAALNLINDNIVNFAIDSSGNLYSPSPTGSLNSRYLNTLAGSVITIPSPCFLIWAGQLTNSADAVVMLNSNVIKYA
jgi:hypothetical protein